MVALIDRLIDRFSMYRLLIYYLLALLVAAIGLSLAGVLHYNPLVIGFSAAYVVAVCWVSNKMFAYVFEAPANPESTIITALILSLIITPVVDPKGLLFLTAAGGLAIASKYILAINNKHIFNPAAIAIVLTSLGAGQSASWWVGSAPLLPLVLLGGVLIIRKVRRFMMAGTFIITACVATAIYTMLAGGSVGTALTQLSLHTAIFFLAIVMLTEPFSSPRNPRYQYAYGFLAGLIFPPQVHLGALYSTPELTLVISNAFSYLVDPPVKALLTLRQRLQRSSNIYDFILAPDRSFRYQPGQYIEVAVPHTATDSRGNRRYFTLASSPTEPEVRLGVKFYENGSSYKHALLQTTDTSMIVATQLGGTFTLPRNRAKKLAFIAGGIGITPFRSMLRYLLDTNDYRDVAVLYATNSRQDIVYADVLSQSAKAMGTRVTYCLKNEPPVQPSQNFISGEISTAAIQAAIPDYRDRWFYVSGPHGMVEHTRRELRSLGVPSSRIKIDFFPGY